MNPPPATSDGAAHESVLLEEVVQALRPSPAFLGVDCTTNGGGHSAALLERTAPGGRMVCLDADPSALQVAEARLAPFAGRFWLVNRNFRDLRSVAAALGMVEAVDGVVFDLGLSSLQLDRSGRGFSFRAEHEPLDMRFAAEGEQATGHTAADLLNTLTLAELEHLFRAYGEEPRARRLATVIVRRREVAPFATAGDLVAAVTQALGPKRGRMHPATRVFQAVRIAVNQELAALDEGLAAAVDILKPGGRVVVISFHSLEDRIVKWRFRGWADPAAGRPRLRVLTRKPLAPTDEERARNPRARSAKLRVAERLPPAGPTT